MREKAAPSTLSPVDYSGGWWRTVLETTPGTWQADVAVRQDRVMAQATVFACMTLIASDIGKLRIKLVEEDRGIWLETKSPAFSPVLSKPNRYQTRQKFVEQWIISKLSAGNTYALKVRDDRNVVIGLYVLDPCRVTPLVAPDGSVYYRLGEDDLNQVPVGLPAVPASEIIHDRMVCLFHPLVGVTPIFACGLAATQALNIQNNSAKFFGNLSKPGGIITAPRKIDDVTAARIKEYWDRNYKGDNIGKVAVLGDGLEYAPMAVNPVDAQLVDQLKLSAEQICSVFHVPAYMVGAAPPPAYNNIEALNQQYYSQCLQALIESLEACLDEGLGLTKTIEGRTLGTELCLDDLLRMDSKTLAEVEGLKVQRGISAPDEARAKFNLPAVTGGGTPYLQQQNYSLEALSKRDASSDPFGTAAPAGPAAPAANDDSMAEAVEAAANAAFQRHLAELRREADARAAEVESTGLAAAEAFEIQRREHVASVAAQEARHRLAVEDVTELIRGIEAKLPQPEEIDLDAFAALLLEDE